MNKAIHTDNAPAAIGPYSQAIRWGNVVYVSGQIPIDPATGAFAGEDIAAQTRQSLTNIKNILTAAGLDMSRVVKTTVMLKDIADFAAMNEVYAEFFTAPYPARAAYQVAALPRDARVEIECVAAFLSMFRVIKTEGAARRGEFTCPHGVVQTPVFMNVGTQGAIKGALSAFDLKEIGCQIELSNTYHLHLRPGDDVVRQMGGLHKFMRWDGPMLTDSGGFQVFSLAGLRKITEEGVTFSSHIDGKRIFMGPEESMRIQSNLGSDVAMAFDECVENPAPYDYAKASCERTLRWLERCKTEHDRLNALPGCVNPGQMLFGINQGATYEDLRVWHMKETAKIDCGGYAIGGLAVGEPTEVMYSIIEAVEPHMPADKPRYLMGVGTPSNIIEGVARGIDFFDCVMPARNARHGKLFTWSGAINLKNERFKLDERPIDPGCDCPVCRNFSRAYLRHLFVAGEMLAMRLAVMHNLYFYNDLVRRIRDALDAGQFAAFRAEYSERLAGRAD